MYVRDASRVWLVLLSQFAIAKFIYLFHVRQEVEPLLSEVVGLALSLRIVRIQERHITIFNGGSEVSNSEIITTT